MIWRSFCFHNVFRTHAAIFAACLFGGYGLAAETETELQFQSADGGIEIAGEFVGFDGEFVTLLTVAGPISFDHQGMTCLGNACPDFSTYLPRLRVVGPHRMMDGLVPALIDSYSRDHGLSLMETGDSFFLGAENEPAQLEIQLKSQDPEDGFSAFLEHGVDVFMSMRELRDDEVAEAADRGLGRLNTARQARILALDALVPATFAGATSDTISISDLIAALAGETKGFDVSISEDMADQLGGFEQRLMQPSNQRFGAFRSFANTAGLTEHVSETEDALTLIPFGALGNTQPLALKGACGLEVEASFLSMKTEDYPLTFPVFLYLPNRRLHPDAQSFLDWLRSPAAQLVIRRSGFVDLAAVPIPLRQQGVRLANAISNAGTEVPLEELQRLVRVLGPQIRMSSTFRFEPGSTRLDGQSRSNVLQLAQSIRDGRFAGQKITFVGFSDGKGPAEANRDLSAARAEAVRRSVVAALGGEIPRTVTIETNAFGEALPMACDDTPWGQQTNRRVEVWVQDAG